MRIFDGFRISNEADETVLLSTYDWQLQYDLVEEPP